MTDDIPTMRRRKGELDAFHPDVEAPPTLWATTADTLRKGIIRGDLPAGVHLAEEELAGRLGVSRGPVRQALARLEHEGLVRLFPRRGGVVLGFTDQDVHEIYDMRRLLEARAGRLAAASPSPAALDELRALASRLAGPAGDGTFEREVTLDLAFHRRLVTMAGQRRLLAAWEPLTATVRALLVVAQARMPGLATAHHQVVRAVESRDPAAAEKVIISHLDRAEERIFATRRERVDPGADL